MNLVHINNRYVYFHFGSSFLKNLLKMTIIFFKNNRVGRNSFFSDLYRSARSGSIILSAKTCTLRICHNIHGVQVFRLLWYDVIYHFLQQPNSLSECSRFGKPAIRAYPISSGLPPLFSASSIASRYTSVFFSATTRSIVS